MLITTVRYLQYLELCSRIVRSCLKEEFKAVAMKRGEEGLKYAKWSEGKQGEVSKQGSANPFPFIEAAKILKH